MNKSFLIKFAKVIDALAKDYPPESLHVEEDSIGVHLFSNNTLICTIHGNTIIPAHGSSVNPCDGVSVR